MLEVGSLAIRNGMEYFHSGCVCFSSRGNEGKGKERDKRIKQNIQVLVVVGTFCCLDGALQYSTQWSSGWIDRQNRQTERQT